jgi:GrpB-like predicted nucleotidyltransferase (UPF0157 family)
MLEIVPYHPEWPLEFEQIASTLSTALGELALRIDHIGSTSVPGLAAKDIIDVQVTVASFDPPLVERFAAAGYTLREGNTADHRPPFDAASPDSDWEKRYFDPPEGARPQHIHVRIQGRANQRYPLLFRDYLRAHPHMASSYAELKRRLAYYHGNDRRTYAEIKDPACDMVITAAETWAEQTGWVP